jgi:ATP-dependent DNA helicase RecG
LSSRPPAVAADSLSTPLQYLKGVGPRRAADLARAGLVTVEDLVFRFPFRYEDRTRMQPIASLRPGHRAAVVGEVKSTQLSTTRRRGFKIFHAVIGDRTGAIRCSWLNQAYLADVIATHRSMVVFGEVKLDSTGLHFLNPEFEIIGDDLEALHIGRIVPFYERTGTVTPNMHRRLVRGVIDSLPAVIPDVLPVPLVERLALVPRRVAIEGAHFPSGDERVEDLNAFRTPAQRRLIFEEFFLYQLGHAWHRHTAGIEAKPYRIVVDDRIRRAAASVLPFQLTPGQRTAIKEIVEDLQRPAPMHRLLQGDVGSGKTVLALLAGVVAMENGLQVALLAPTEILATQHYATLAKALAGTRFRVDLLTGATPGTERHTTLAHLERGSTHLVVGTHALVQEKVTFHQLGLVVIDEQHRFGVAQRAAMRDKGLRPDVLLMTATPIPRTLALTDYSELDVSKIVGLPPGRQPVRTWVKPESRREEIYDLIRREVAAGRQAYVIYPLVEESEKLDLKSATEMADRLQAEVFPTLRVGVVHGRMKQEAKDQVMHGFASGVIDILVSTTVVEVGVDVPNATVMVVEHAERFGLSQLHQLRGRIGRGAFESHCVLLYQAPWTDEARERLSTIASTTDGFLIAEKDLELRGPGDFYGTRQSGVPRLRAGDVVRDRDVMEEAHREARALVASGTLPDPLSRFVAEVWPQRFGLAQVG